MVKKKLTDAITRDLPRLDKPYYKPGDYPGLQLWVYPSGVKTWRYQYRTKYKKYQQRKHLGNYPTISVTAAVKRARELSEKIYEINIELILSSSWRQFSFFPSYVFLIFEQNEYKI